MGCGNPKEKIEDQMMRLKMARIDLQMERQNQLEQLRNLGGPEMKTPSIPDYIDQNFLKDYIMKNTNINSNEEETLRSKQKRSKSHMFKSGNSLAKVGENGKRRKSLSRKSIFKRKSINV